MLPKSCKGCRFIGYTSSGTVCDYMKYKNISRGMPIADCILYEGPRNYIERNTKKVKSLFDRGLSDDEIGKKVNLSASQVATIRQKNKWYRKRGREKT